MWYPIVVYLHLSNPVLTPSHEIAFDFVGGGIGLETKRGITVEVALGVSHVGCAGSACGVQAGGTINVTWRGKNGRRN